MRTYTELSELDSFEDRFRYLRLRGDIGKETFGFDRYLNQILYKSRKWQDTRDRVIIRDNGFDLGHPDHPIPGRIIIHHMNPITIEQALNEDPIVYDPEFLISTFLRTHNAIHFGDESILQPAFVERTPNDTCPWR